MTAQKNLRNADVSIRSNRFCGLAVIQKWLDGSDFVVAMPKELHDDLELNALVVMSRPEDFRGLSENMRSNRELALLTLSKTSAGKGVLQNFSEKLRNDKEVVVAAVAKDGWELRHAGDDLKNDADCLRAAGLWMDSVHYGQPHKVVLSIKYGQAATSTPYATDFAKLLLKDEYLREFQTHNPNIWCKKQCKNPKCLGTLAGCSFTEAQNINPQTNKPSQASCWRVSFRHHLEEARDTGGFMLQLEEEGGLGEGQKLEAKMAEELEIKVFRVYTDKMDENGNAVFPKDIKKVGDVVEAWYRDTSAGNRMVNVENVWTGFGSGDRPKYQS